MKKLALGLVFAVLVVLSVGSNAIAQDSDAVRINLINGIPDSSLDVGIGGENVISGFDFRDTHDLASFAGQAVDGLVFTQAGSDEIVLDAGDVELPADGNISVLLHLKVDGSPNLSIFENDLSRVAAGESRLVIRHLAAAPPVDVLAAGEVVFEGLGNGQERSADLAAGDVNATLVPSGEDGPIVIGPADLPLVEGDLLVVYGLGSLAEDTMTVITESVSGLGTPPSAVDTGNSAIDGAGTASRIVGGLLIAVGLIGFGLTGFGPERLRSALPSPRRR